MMPDQRDQIVFDLYERLIEIEQRLVPTGLHVFGEPPRDRGLADLLRMVVSYDRPEWGARSLPNLIASGLGLPGYEALLDGTATTGRELEGREKVEAVTQEAMARFLQHGADAAIDYLTAEANVAAEASGPVFAALSRVRQQLEANSEMNALVRALRGEYIEPGPGADIVQNPDILPTGRNTYAVNPYHIPSPVAVQRAQRVVEALLNRHLKEQGRYPKAMAMVLWGMDNIKTQGESVAQALFLLGVKPRRDGLNRATDVEVIPLEQLRRPRIDVVMTVSGIFRDLFAPTMALLDKAVRRVAALDEPEEMNYVKRNVERKNREGLAYDDAAVRVFSNAPGHYGTNVDMMILGGQWEKDDQLADLFMMRKSFAYGRDLEGQAARQLMEGLLEQVEVTYQNLDTLEIGLTDVDHYFEYLGGITKAVEKQAGARPQVYVADSLTPAAKVRSLEETIQLETRTKALNPKWYEGMLEHGFRGVAEIEKHVTNTFGWSATADAVDGWVYDEVAKTYVLEESMLQRLKELNPHSTHSLVGRLLEAAGRGFWVAEAPIVAQLREVLGDLEDELEGVSSSVAVAP
jgi:magnesium chelatase subunit H